MPIDDNGIDAMIKEIAAAKMPISSEIAFKYAQLLQSTAVVDTEFQLLEESWKELCRFYREHEAGAPMVSRVTSPYGHTAIEAFKFNLEFGHYPPPEILLCIAEGFDRYVHAGGKLSLDEAFFGEKHKHGKSLPNHKSKAETYGFFHVEVTLNDDARLSLENLAEGYISKMRIPDSQKPDVESYLRGYRRWKRRYLRSPLADEDKN